MHRRWKKKSESKNGEYQGDNIRNARKMRKIKKSVRGNKKKRKEIIWKGDR